VSANSAKGAKNGLLFQIVWRLKLGGLDLVGFGWIRLDSVGFGWIWLDLVGFGWIRLDLVGFGWIPVGFRLE
jgi:hypothetical protein